DMTLPLLMDNIAFMPLITLGKYNGTFKAKAGDTIQVIRPARVTAIDGTADISSSYIDFAETAVNITLDKIATVPRKWTSKEATLNMDDLQRLVVQPAVNALAEQVNLDLLDLYKSVYNFSGTAGTTPSTLASITAARKILQDNRAPSNDRAYVFDTAAEAAYLNLDTFSEVDKSGTNSALRDAALGRVMGMMLAADNQVITHTSGLYTALTDLTSNGIQAVDATTFNIESAAGTSTDTVLEGDIFTIETGDAAGQYVVTADSAAAVAGAVAVSIDPPLRGATADTDTVAFADEGEGAHVANLMFQKEAFTLASAPLEGAIGGANSAFATAHGLTITVTQDYDINTNTNLIRFDYLYGVQATMPDLAVRVMG
ncbi:MAG: P22 coat protein, partial [Gammaproteobacteria bacterium]|nr:P22 coat protein [Gammaproteobacteria bacterium]